MQTNEFEIILKLLHSINGGRHTFCTIPSKWFDKYHMTLIDPISQWYAIYDLSQTGFY